MGRAWNYIGWGFLLLVLGASAVSFGETSGQGEATVGTALATFVFVVLFIGSLVAFFMPLSKNTKRIKCSSCGTKSTVGEITSFQQLPREDAAA
jgi:hypothetical protein